MKALALAFAFALAAGASPAAAALQIAFANSGGGAFFCADQTACDLDGAAKNLLLLNTMVGNIRIEGTFAASTSHPDTLSVSNLTIANLGSSAETLTMAVGDTGFAGPVQLVRSSASATFNTDNSEPFALTFFADPANLQPAATASDLPGVSLFSVLGTVSGNPDSDAGTHVTPFDAAGPFSMAEAASLTLAPGASVTGFNQSMAGGVPEPSTWAMLLLGAGGLMLMAAGRRGQAVWPARRRMAAE